MWTGPFGRCGPVLWPRCGQPTVARCSFSSDVNRPFGPDADRSSCPEVVTKGPLRLGPTQEQWSDRAQPRPRCHCQVDTLDLAKEEFCRIARAAVLWPHPPETPSEEEESKEESEVRSSP